MKDLRIVVPAHDEESSIGELLERIRETCPDAEIVVVDDGSKDNTATIAKGKGAKVISKPTSYGYGRALKTGFNDDFGPDSDIKYFAFLDADGTYLPEKLPELYNLCKEGGSDIAVGSRLIGKNEGMSLMRKFGNKLFAFLTSMYTGRKVTDTGSGLRVFKASLLRQLQSFPDGLSLTPAMTINALFEGLAYTEIPIEYHKRTGKSKLSNLKDGYRFLRAIMYATRHYRPALFFCTLGMPFLLVEQFLRIVSALRRSRVG